MRVSKPALRIAAARRRGRSEIQSFLIADIRGYTTFTRERGDEAGAKLATKFAELAKDAVEARGGAVIELRGDEALADNCLPASVWIPRLNEWEDAVLVKIVSPTA
jgi:class 3 adenylate cyclase